MESTATPRTVTPATERWLFALGAGLIAAAVFAVAATKNSEYLARFVPYGDVSSYYSNQIQSYLRVLDHGAWPEIEWQLRGNIRNVRFLGGMRVIGPRGNSLPGARLHP